MCKKNDNTMKNIKNHYIYGQNLASKSDNKKKTRSLCQSIAGEKLNFKDGEELGSLSIGIEDGATKRIVRRIVEKRVYKDYWKQQKNGGITNNKHRAATKKNVSRVTQKIFGQPVKGFSYLAA